MSRPNRVRVEAEVLSRLGLDPIPLEPGEKKPAISRFSGGDRLPLREFDRLFYRGCNLGLRTGRGLLIVDIDNRESGLANWREFVGARPLPETASAASARGGLHLYYALPSGVLVGSPGRPFGLTGIDVKGDGGIVAVPPSRLAGARRKYGWVRHPREGISPIPDWILEPILAADAKSRPTGQGRKVAEVPVRAGDVLQWVAWAIEHHPIPGPGNRHHRLAKLIPALVRRYLDDTTIMAVGRAWWDYHFARGLCTTDPSSEADGEIGSYLRTVRDWADFVIVQSGDYHRIRRREIELSPEARRLIGPDAGQAQRRAGGAVLFSLTNSDAFSVGGVWTDCIARRRGPAAFVEALVIQVVYQRSINPAGPIRMTYDDLRDIVADHHPEIQAKCKGGRWSDGQMGRYFDQFVDRLETNVPADEHRRAKWSLLRRVVRGHNAFGSQAAIPSEFEVTGLATVLELGYTMGNSAAPASPEMAMVGS